MIKEFKIFENLDSIDKLKKDLSIIKKRTWNCNAEYIWNKYYDMPFTMDEYNSFGHANMPKLFTEDGYIKEPERMQKDTLFNSVKSFYGNCMILKTIIDSYGRKLKLCDLGCGIGNILYFPRKLGYDVMGVEMQKRFEPIYNKYNLEVINGDLLNMDISFLKNMDIVYVYRPIRDHVLMNSLLDRVYTNMRSGSILIVNFTSALDLSKFKKIVELWGSEIMYKE